VVKRFSVVPASGIVVLRGVVMVVARSRSEACAGRARSGSRGLRWWSRHRRGDDIG